MLHILILIPLLLALASTSPVLKEIVPADQYEQYGTALEAIFGMGLRLNGILDPGNKKNFVVSPISTTVIIAQLMLGAEGDFRDDLYELLSLDKDSHSIFVHNSEKGNNHHYPSKYGKFHLQLASLIKALKEKNVGEEFTMNQNNALFYNKDITLKAAFRARLYKLYDPEIQALDFYKDTRPIINKWAYDNTNGLIRTIVNSPLPPSTSSVFLNSIYFRAEWEKKFSDELNVNDKFYVDKDTTVQTTYMRGLFEYIRFGETPDYTVICLPYLKKELGMYIILPSKHHPHQYNISQFTLNLNIPEMLRIVANARFDDVVVKIPKLSLSNRLSILEPLRKYSEVKRANLEPDYQSNSTFGVIKEEINLYRRFQKPPQTDIILTDAAENTNLKISDIVQQMVFSINENGTEAAAITAGITDYRSSKSFVLNRPFSFFIRHEETLATIFWGTISDPSQS